jgi:hypothetical protein
MAVLLAAIVLIATSGFTVFKHSCSTENTIEFSLLFPEFKCEHYQQEASLLACCCTILEPNNDEAYDKNKCCNTDTFVVKMNITIDLQNYHKIVDAPVAILIAIEETDLSPDRDEINHIIVSNDLPPPLSGKALHVFLNQLNIPFTSV